MTHVISAIYNPTLGGLTNTGVLTWANFGFMSAISNLY
jgi:hypothetical protein